MERIEPSLVDSQSTALTITPHAVLSIRYTTFASFGDAFTFHD